jgi:hypothetical protein
LICRVIAAAFRIAALNERAMNALTHYLTNVVHAKTGLSGSVLVGYAAQAALALVTAVLGLFAIFFVFADWLEFGPTATSIGMFLVFVLLLIISIVWTSSAKKRTLQEAQQALRAPKLPVLLSPPLLSAGTQLARSVGWRRFAPAALAAVFATGIAAEWTRRRHAGGRQGH